MIVVFLFVFCYAADVTCAYLLVIVSACTTHPPICFLLAIQELLYM